MESKFLKIKIGRFEAGRALAREIYLHMPVNGKMIRIISVGDEFRPSLLERLRERGFSYLYASPSSGDLEEDPDTLPLYEEISQDVTVKAELPLSSIAEEFPQEAITKISKTLEVEETSLKFGKTPKEDATRVVKGILETPDSTVTQLKNLPDDQHSILITKVSGDSLEETTTKFKNLTEQESSQNISRLREAQSALKILKATQELVLTTKALENAVTPEREELLALAINLNSAIDNIQSGLPAPDEFDRRFPIERELDAFNLTIASDKEESLKALFIKAEASTNDRAWALKRLESIEKDDLPFSSQAAITYREMPVVAGRLAAYMGYSIGYVNLNFLTDLALGTILYFSQKEGMDIKNENLSSLNKAILSRESNSFDAPIDDALEIINFLDVYFGNPRCDKTKKDFSNRIFTDTLNELHQSNREPNPWNEIRWTQFLEMSPTISSINLCSKASTLASKTSKEIVH